MKGAADPNDWDDIEQYYDRRKQALIRKLLRIQNGEEYVDVEVLKRKMRSMARMIYNLQLVIKDNQELQAIPAVQAVLNSSPEIVAEVNKIIGYRRSW